MKPVRLHASATLALPRWGLLALALLYILAGLIGRDPWKNADAAGFGIMWTMAHGNLHDWLLPNIVGMPIIEDGPLAYWISALFIKFFGGLFGDAMAARITNIFFFLFGTISLWLATYRLGKRSEAQPMQLAFGGHPQIKDYGRMLADGALLIYIGCLGLLMHSHETKPEALLVSLAAVLLYASVRYAESPGFRNACFIGLTLGCMALTESWVMPHCVMVRLVGAIHLASRKAETYDPPSFHCAGNRRWHARSLARGRLLDSALQDGLHRAMACLAHWPNRLADI